MNDLETARKIAAGDPEAAERFVRNHYATVFRLLRHLTRNREDAEDLTQQTFLVARASIGAYQARAGLKTWICRIAYNEYRQWKRRRRPVFPLTQDRTVEETGYGSIVEGESLLSALATLSDSHREAFLLHEVEDLTVTEVAQILRVPVGTIKARLFYARRKLRAHLEDGMEATTHVPKESLL